MARSLPYRPAHWLARKALSLAGPGRPRLMRGVHAVRVLGLTGAMGLAGMTGLAGLTAPAQAATPTETTVSPSQLDAPLFYQLLIGEIELRQGEPATAYAVLLDAARRTRDETLYERAMEIALRAQAGNEALAATAAWRRSHPQSQAAVQAQVRILLAMQRYTDLQEPLQHWLGLVPAEDRNGVISSLPRLFREGAAARAGVNVLQAVLTPFAEQAAHRVPSQLALARMLVQAGQAPAALALARDAAQRQPDAPGPALIALDLLNESPEARGVLDAYLEQASAEAWVRLAYAQWLVAQSKADVALEQLRKAVQRQPDLAQAWFSLGLVAHDQGQRTEAEQALQRYLALAPADAEDGPEAGPTARTESAAAAGNERSPESSPSERPAARARPVWTVRMLLSQWALERKNYAQALALLDPLDPKGTRIDVQSRKAFILSQQGDLPAARALLRSLPATSPDLAAEKVLAEAQLLRSVERWNEARTVLVEGLRSHPDAVELLYELSMVLERLERYAEMELHLRRILVLKPDHAHAHNALGYSLAERGIRLDEARTLIERALELSPGDPFITDSLAWVAFRQGLLPEAERLLRKAYRARPDTEIGTHLAEVLWTQGQKEEARALWRTLQERDSKNRLLKQTLARLKVRL